MIYTLKEESIMRGSRETDRRSSHEFDIPQPYTPMPDGFERPLQAWVHLPLDGGTILDMGDASALPKEPGTRDHA
jgi:hypothetical protein